MPGETVDEVDRAILSLLAENARRSMEDIGSRVALSPSSVTRRIARLERLGVVLGYTVVLGGAPGRPVVRALSELGLTPGLSFEDLLAWAAQVPEVEAVHRISGAHEALISWRLDDLTRLPGLLDELAAKLEVRPVRTEVVLESWEAERAGGPALALGTLRSPR